MAKRDNPFSARVERAGVATLRIVVHPRDRKDQVRRYRQLAVCVYKLAAEMERRTERLGAHWVVSPEVFNSRIDLELTDRDDEQAAARFVAKVLADLGLT
jgi:hypothetical protein